MRLSIPSLKTLRAFEAVGRLESVSGAARAIHLSQPAVTQAIAKMESIVGESLFDRRATGTFLTADGVELLGFTSRLLVALESSLLNILPGRSASELQGIINKLTNSRLECLIAVTECGTSVSAAKRYETHESSINRSVRELENILGARLVRRTAEGYQTLEAGAAFSMRVAHAFHEFSDALQMMFDNRQAGVICIGAPVLDNAGLLSAVVNELAALKPSVTVRLFNEPFESLRLRLRTGTLDIIVGVLKPHSPDLTSEVLLEEEYVVVGRRDHPLISAAKVTVEDLSRFGWIVPNRNAPRREVFERLFEAAPSRPAANIETHSLATITMTLASSERLTILTKSELMVEGALGRLAEVPFSLGGAHSQIGLTYPTSSTHSPHRDALIETFRRHAQQLGQRFKPDVDSS